MNENVLSDHLVNDTIRFEIYLPVSRYTDPAQLRRDMSTLG